MLDANRLDSDRRFRGSSGVWRVNASNLRAGDPGPSWSEEEAVDSEATVLTVDPSDADRARLREALSGGGFSVHEVSQATTTEVLEASRRIRPHLIVLGANLSDVDETALCRAVRAEASIAETPILILTAGQTDAFVLAGLNAGADDYIVKDSAPELLLARAKRLIQYRRLAGLALLDRQLVQIGRLLAGIIHEIRGPLSVIRGSAELLRLTLQDRPDELQWVESILRGSSLLQHRLEHLMGAVRTGPPQRSPVELNSLLTEAVDLFVKGLPRDHLRVQLEVGGDGPPRILGDAGRLMQVVFDLLTNAQQAVAARGGGGVIVLRSSGVHEERGDWVKLEIIDNGPGIPEIYLHRIFEPFFTTRQGGSGYGLYLASEITREMGGRITVANNPNEGACFTVWLPVEPKAQASPPPEETRPADAAPPQR